MSRALVFGGAFNPPTLAHIKLADYAREECGFDQVIFVPSKQTYISHEQKKDDAISDVRRYEMLKRIAEKRSWMLVSDYELRQEKQPRTYQTLCHFRKEGYEVSLLFGSDKLTELREGWLHVHEIASEFGIVCMKRADEDVSAIIDNDPYLTDLKQYIRIVNTPDDFQFLSSTMIRKVIREEGYEAVRNWIPAELEEYYRD